MIFELFSNKKNLSEISVNLDFIFHSECFYFFSDEFLRSHMPNTESVFKGEFIVLEGDFLPQGAVQIGKSNFQLKILPIVS